VSEDFREVVLRIREDGGSFEFRRHPESLSLYVHVELRIPGVFGLSTFATYPVYDEDSDASKADAALRCYRACKSKILMMNPPSVPGELSTDDDETMRELGMRWEK
jgi:hypothetical protein